MCNEIGRCCFQAQFGLLAVGRDRRLSIDSTSLETKGKKSSRTITKETMTKKKKKKSTNGASNKEVVCMYDVFVVS
jgi:hypothetical protein